MPARADVAHRQPARPPSNRPRDRMTEPASSPIAVAAPAARPDTDASVAAPSATAVRAAIDPRDAALRELLSADPVARLLLVRARLHYVVVGLLCLALLLITLFALPLRFPAASPAPTLQEFLPTMNGTMMIVSWLLFVPVVWGFYAWQPVATVGLLRRLRELTSAGADTAIRVSPWYRLPAWTVIAVLLAAWEFYRFMFTHEFTNAGPWVFNSTVVVRAAFVFLASITYYMVAQLVIRQFITTIEIDRLFRREHVPVQFLHPDGCGGLRVLGDHALGIVPLILVTGLNISLVYVRMITGGPLGSDTAVYSLVAVTVLYVAGFIACFLAPLWRAHEKMVAARDRWLDDIARGFDLQQALVASQMRDGKPDADAVAKLETVRRAWDIGRSLPTWPLNVGGVGKFTAALFSPLIPIGIAALQQLLLR
jgi:hypothetical protein